MVIISLIIVALICYLLSKQDCDLVLLFFEKFGNNPRTLKGKVVWILGASSGIGRDLAYELANAGCKIILSATRQHRLEEVREQCLKLNGRLTEKDILVLPLDLSKIEQHNDAFQKVIATFGKLDILVNNAARLQVSQFEQTELAVDRELFELNTLAVINMTRLVTNDWLDRKQSGHLAVTSSAGGFCPSKLLQNKSCNV